MGSRAGLPALVATLAFVAAGCGDGDSSAVACSDAAFKAQDEELYVARTAVANAIGRAGDPEFVLADLRRARTALGSYVDAHPPCDDVLREVERRERGAISDLDDAIAALEEGAEADRSLSSADRALGESQDALKPVP